MFIEGEVSVSAMSYNNKIVKQSESKENIVGELPDAHVKLLASEGTYTLENFKLIYNGGVQSFPSWKNEISPVFSPKLFYKDINQDGQKELIIVLTTYHGSDLHIQEVHVLHKIQNNKSYKYTEIIVENPSDIFHENVKTTLTKSEAIIIIGDKKNIIKLKKFGVEPSHIYSSIDIENALSYEIKDNKLTAILGARIAPSVIVGNFLITYIFKNGRYQMSEIEFAPL
jgi:hypothetical protein